MLKKKLVILSGRPMGGKDSLTGWLAQTYGLVQFSSGEKYRQMMHDPVNGPVIARCQRDGTLVPDHIHMPIFREVWPRFSAVNWGKPIGLNGALRTLGQAALVAYIRDQHLVATYDLVQIFLDTTEEECLRRLQVARSDPNRRGRLDDDPRVFETRLAEFRHKTEPAIKAIELMVVPTVRIPINGHSKAEVCERARASLGLPAR